MSPVGRTRPLAAVSSLCAALSICGLPPFAGFWSKLLLIIACLEAGRPGLALLAVIVSMLTVAYYFKALGPVVTGDLARPETAPVPRHIAGTAALVLLTVLAVCGGVLLMPSAPRTLITHAASVLTNGAGYASIIMGVAK